MEWTEKVKKKAEVDLDLCHCIYEPKSKRPEVDPDYDYCLDSCHCIYE